LATQSFKALTYYAIGGPTTRVEMPQSMSSLQALWFELCSADEPVALIGAGSNILCSDAAFDGTVLSCRRLTGWQVLTQTEGACSLLIEAGVTNTECAEIALELGFSDAAWMNRMPGQLGATIRMNARCYGGEISQLVTDVFTLDPSGHFGHHRGKQVFRGYKDTILMDNKEIVTAAILQLSKPAKTDDILAIMEGCESDRHRKKHFLYPSCGSTFRNNYSLGKPSGQIFDELGLKGRSAGGAQISEHHGNFIFNKSNATAQDILSLAATMAESASSNGMDLMLEVQPVGKFSHHNSDGLKLQELDPSTVTTDDHILTGLLRYGRLGPETALQIKQSGGCDPGIDLDSKHWPRRLCALPFAGWDPSHAASLGRLRLEAWQHLPKEQDKGARVLRVAFVCESMAHWEALTRDRPSIPGFQDHLWNQCVFECFLMAEDTNGRYLELEIQDNTTWLGLELEGTRVRTARSATPAPIPGITPFGPVFTGQDNEVAVGFDLNSIALEPYLAGNTLRIKGAYAGKAARDENAKNPTVSRIYGTAPPRPHQSQLSGIPPDFHTADDTVLLKLH
jgi:UDP-N-acetylmuramate dehydrogenase